MDLREEDFRAEIVFGFGCGGVETWSGEGGSPWLCRTAGNPGTDPLRMTARSANDARSVTATSQVISTDPSFVNSYTQASIHAIYTYSILVDCN
jgi:hypothetical protein